MEQGGVTTAILSFTPQVLTALAQGGAITPAHHRRTNEFGAKLVADHPGRYGLFAGIPLAEPDAALKEIDYAFSSLRPTGSVAQIAQRPSLLAHQAVAPKGHLLFGTDFPYLTVLEHVDGLKDARVFSAKELRGIDTDVTALIPRLAI